MKGNTGTAIDTAFAPGFNTTTPVTITANYKLANPSATISFSGGGSGTATVNASIASNANGDIVNGPLLSWVGEDGPEAIIPLGSKRRSRGLSLWEKAGELLGVKKYAEGGIVESSRYTSNPFQNYPTISQGTKVGVCETVQDKDGDPWYYVQIKRNQGEKYGFVAAAYITKQSSSKPNADTTVSDDGVITKTPQWVGKVTADVLNVRAWAGTNNPIIKSWPRLGYGNLVDVCDVVNATDGSRWYYVRIDGRIYGFVHSAYIARA